MDDNKKLLCAAAGALGALLAVSATVFAVKQHKKKQNAILIKELDCCLETDDLAELANESEETKAQESADEKPTVEANATEEEKATAVETAPAKEPTADTAAKSEAKAEKAEEVQDTVITEEKPTEKSIVLDKTVKE